MQLTVVGYMQIRKSSVKPVRSSRLWILHFLTVVTEDFVTKENINPIKAGGHNVSPPYRFLPCSAKTVCSRLMKLSDF